MKISEIDLTGTEEAGSIEGDELFLVVENNEIKTKSISAALNDYSLGSPIFVRWSSGVPFFIPAGDGASAGLRFTTDGSGAFTLSAAVLTGLVVPSFYAYLPADSAYTGQTAGWYYGTMSTSTAGILYANTYDSTSQIAPVIPAAPTDLPTTGTPKYITQSVAEVTCCQKQVPSIGKNGTIELSVKILASSSSTAKNVFFRAGSTTLWNYSVSTNSDLSGNALIRASGSESSQVSTRASLFEGGAASSISSDIKAIDLSSGALLKVSAQVAANTESIFLYARKIATIYGA